MGGNHTLTEAQKRKGEAGCFKKEKTTSEGTTKESSLFCRGASQTASPWSSETLRRGTNILTNDCKNDGWTICSQSSSDKEGKVSVCGMQSWREAVVLGDSACGPTSLPQDTGPSEAVHSSAHTRSHITSCHLTADQLNVALSSHRPSTHSQDDKCHVEFLLHSNY